MMVSHLLVIYFNPPPPQPRQRKTCTANRVGRKWTLVPLMKDKDFFLAAFECLIDSHWSFFLMRTKLHCLFIFAPSTQQLSVFVLSSVIFASHCQAVCACLHARRGRSLSRQVSSLNLLLCSPVAFTSRFIFSRHSIV